MVADVLSEKVVLLEGESLPEEVGEQEGEGGASELEVDSCRGGVTGAEAETDGILPDGRANVYKESVTCKQTVKTDESAGWTRP